MSFFDIQEKEKWLPILEKRISKAKITLPSPLLNFMKSWNITHLDYGEFESEKWGEIDIRYIDFEVNGEKYEVRRTSQIDDYNYFWGFEFDNEEDHFDEVLKRTYHLTEEQVDWAMETIEEFMFSL